MTYSPQGPYPGPSGYPQQGPYAVGQPVAPGYPAYGPPAAYGPPGYGPVPGQPMPYGYPGATPPNSGGPGKWILIVGAVVLVLVLGGVGIYALTGSSDDDQSTSASSASSQSGQTRSGGTAPRTSSGANSEEDEIRQFLASFGGGDIASISCANDRKFFGQAGGGAFGSMPVPKVAGDPESMKTLDITVTGDRATVQPPGSSQVAIWLRKEGGEWKLCSTDNPVFKNLPGMK
ncbi:hypothetical protein [Mycolicibacterium mucogenicum]|uniref:DUF4878 domain-containing protein n=1 Tax=Mycolicibacterium mucogenicum DSM 44124 TaxID=1226753 RepID=A0A8H2JBR9_MYCMU|nr:hypothetical protein [Mycolicibacterium mucogenicum]QPG71380.1 hypothetical protein C1S78_010880 [Mycolicibacterium mucogenicum DSM 44124]